MTVSSAPQGTSQPSHGSPSRNIFEDPAIAAAAANDPFAKWLVSNWRTIVVVVAAGILGTVAYLRFSSVALEKRSAATRTLNQIQATYSELVAKEDSVDKLRETLSTQSEAKDRETTTSSIEKGDREVEQLRDKVVLMADSLTDPRPFGSIGKLYKGLVASHRKRFEETRTVLEEISFSELGGRESSERFIGELVTLALARSLLDSDQHRAFGRERLIALAEAGEFAAVQASNALLIAARSPEETEQVKALVTKVKSRFPGESQFINTASDSQ